MAVLIPELKRQGYEIITSQNHQIGATNSYLFLGGAVQKRHNEGTFKRVDRCFLENKNKNCLVVSNCGTSLP